MAIIRDDDEERRVRVEERLQQLQRHADDLRRGTAESASERKERLRAREARPRRERSS